MVNNCFFNIKGYAVYLWWIVTIHASSLITFVYNWIIVVVILLSIKIIMRWFVLVIYVLPRPQITASCDGNDRWSILHNMFLCIWFVDLIFLTVSLDWCINDWTLWRNSIRVGSWLLLVHRSSLELTISSQHMLWWLIMTTWVQPRSLRLGYTKIWVLSTFNT